MIITVTNTNDNGPGSLRRAIAQANSGDTIKFANNLQNQKIILSSGELIINKNLIIDGRETPGINISGNNTSRVIDLQKTQTYQPTSLTIYNLTISDGRTTVADKAGAGAGIRTENDSTLTVYNSKFINNRAAGLGGGAIYSGYKSRATIINSQFDRNDASQALRDTTGSLSEHAGGAILIWSESQLTIKGSTFTNNTGVNGGAVNNLLSSLNIENSQFINNNSLAGKNSGHGAGGAIYTDGASNNNDNIGGRIRIFNSRFEANQGAGQGGALFLFAYPPDQIIIDRSQIINNRVIFNSRGDALGAGVRAGNGNFTMTNSTVANNLALSQGGGLWLGERGTSRIVNSTFSGNQAYQVQLDSNDQPLRDSQGNYIPVFINEKKQGLGGAIKLKDDYTTNIINTTVANNYAGFQGGAFWGGNDTVTTLTNSIFANNTADNPWNVKLQSGVMFQDGGGNIQFPAKQTTDPQDVNLTANIRIVNPRLGELQQLNGVLVHPILPGSPAIDFATGAGTPARDQLQKVRLDGNNDNIITPDSGAYEYTTAPLRGINQRGTTNNDTLQGTIGNDTLTGLAGNDIFNGDFGGDRLVGNTGNDQLSGGFGDDTLIGGDGGDRFIFDINQRFSLNAGASIGNDRLTDFTPSQLDKIVLDKTTFTSLQSVARQGFSVTQEWRVVTTDTAAANSVGEIVYNSSNGKLFYNPNGATAGFEQGGLFATLTNIPTLRNSDFIIRS
jgi:predicted outer membrane repeat protein